MDRAFALAGALSAFIAVAAGAFGAHALRAKLAPDLLAVFETGARYQMYHALALIAVAILLPESRSAQRPGVDVLGVILSSAGLAGLTYGFIKAGQDGWTDAGALGTIAAGAAVLAVLVAWERWLTGRNEAAVAGSPHGGRQVAIRPLIELRLFRSAGFTWGTVLLKF